MFFWEHYGVQPLFGFAEFPRRPILGVGTYYKNNMMNYALLLSEFMVYQRIDKTYGVLRDCREDEQGFMF